MPNILHQLPLRSLNLFQIDILQRQGLHFYMLFAFAFILLIIKPKGSYFFAKVNIPSNLVLYMKDVPTYIQVLEVGLAYISCMIS